MTGKADNQMKKMLGIPLIMVWTGVILYSSYRIEIGLTEIGQTFLVFVERLIMRWFGVGSEQLLWLEPALKRIVHIEGFILLGVFSNAGLSWRGIGGSRRWKIVLALAILVGVMDEGYQQWILQGDWYWLDLIWDGVATLVGYEIYRFVEYSNK